MRVVVLGSGISGLTTAEALLDRGHSVSIVSDAAPTKTTSHLAAAVWFPTAAGPADKVNHWGHITFAALEKLSQTGAPGVRMCQSLTVYRSKPGVPDWAESVADFRPAAPAELPPGYSHGWRFTVPLVEMPIYLPYLSRQVHARATCTSRAVTSLAELAAPDVDVIVNCAGLAARELVGDAATVPIRGQIVLVPNPGLTMSVRDENHPLGRAYVHPRSRDCVLGGTLDTGEWDTTADPALTASILARCADIVPALAGAQATDVLVGLRPGRPEVRLELDLDAVAGTPVVHNYGHGGSGVTIGVGCAHDVAALVDSLE